MDGDKPIITLVVRGTAAALLLVAAIVMFVNYQKVDADSYILTARYNHWNGLMFSAIVNTIGCIYNLGILFIPSGSQLWKTIILLDVVVNIIVGGTSLGAAWQTYFLLRDGNLYVGWPPMCPVVHYFCSKILGSLITSTIGFFLTFGLLICTLHVSVDPFLVES